ncbi:hypothetical protein N7489_000072 [Penicillium chrysogenum]|uniref:Uncharacterized protein n=1 Tax=Penicillium chrysogenum TaxID=5076 RepID=A0ABQ8WF23_PENCH|nr:uncharacterized protein N7489_000072 [Penicillium chrysogenum]KAJ5249662.1 hypothetical protein N7489_000072 [Penicillium chrysogenum]KAJ5268566.1 hypothetical protein N7505_004324 [Penicillium chrysogenum]KAJ6148727.1 hypothetical protein N7497_010709 [Penicillium chrysogenum]
MKSSAALFSSGTGGEERTAGRYRDAVEISTEMRISPHFHPTARSRLIATIHVRFASMSVLLCLEGATLAVSILICMDLPSAGSSLRWMMSPETSMSSNGPLRAAGSDLPLEP